MKWSIFRLLLFFLPHLQKKKTFLNISDISTFYLNVYLMGLPMRASQQGQQYLATPFPGVSPTIKSLIIMKERGRTTELVLPYLKCEQSEWNTVEGVAVGVMTRFYPMELHSGQAAWGTFTWPTPFPTSFPLFLYSVHCISVNGNQKNLFNYAQMKCRHLLNTQPFIPSWPVWVSHLDG